MLAIRRCLFGSSKGGRHDKHKYDDIPSISKEGFHLNISSDPLFAPSNKAQPQPESALEDGDELHMEPLSNKTIVEEARHDEGIVEEAPPEKIIVKEPRHDEAIVKEAQPDKAVVEEAPPNEPAEELAPLYKLLLEEPEESKLNQIFRDLIGPYKSPEQLGDLSNNLGLHEPDCSSLNMCTEILGSESCDNMVKDMSEAVTEWSWSHKRQKKKAIDTKMLANRGLPPPIPRYAGRPCHFMKIKRCNGRITMNEVVMDRQPEVMQIERDDGEIKMQLMMYIGDAENDDADEASTSTLFMVDAQSDDAEASTSTFYLIGDAWNDDAGASTSTLHVGDAPKNDAEASAMNVVDGGDDDVETTTLAMYVEDAKNDDAEASASALYVGDARSHDAKTSTSGSTSHQVAGACEETTNEEEEEEEEEEAEETTDESDSNRKGKKVAAKAA